MTFKTSQNITCTYNLISLLTHNILVVKINPIRTKVLRNKISKIKLMTDFFFFFFFFFYFPNTDVGWQLKVYLINQVSIESITSETMTLLLTAVVTNLF